MGISKEAVRTVARALIQNEAGELLLCRSRNGKAWVPPGGTVEPDETLKEAAAREAMEEAGLPVTVGALVYLQEFRPASRSERVVEVAFRALPQAAQPASGLPGLAPAGGPDCPWAAWFIQDVDGPRREVRWFARHALEALEEPVYPLFLRHGYWEGGEDPYLGLVQA